MAEENENLVSRIVRSNPDEVPTELTQLFVRNLSNSDALELSNVLETKYPITLDHSTTDDFKNLQRSYKNHQSIAFMERTAIEAEGALLKGVFTVVSAPAMATGVGAIAVVGTQIIMDKLFDETLKNMEENVARKSQNLIGFHLQEVRKQTGKSMEEISQMGTREARQFLFGEGSSVGIMDNSIDFLKQEDKVVALHEMSKIFADKISHAAALNKFVNEAQADDITILQRETALLKNKQRVFQQTFDDMGQNIVALEEGLNDLSGQVQNLAEDVDQNKDNIAILSDHLFSNANVDGKIKLLASGILGVKGKEKKKLEAQLNALKSKQDLQKNVQNYLDKSQHIVKILDNIGFDSEVVKKANELINVGNVAMSAFAAYSSGNVIGAVSAISSLFGGKSGSDPAAQRHAQIMNKLNLMDKKLDNILENQARILEGLSLILNGLNDLSNVVHKLHAVEMNKIHTVLGAVLYNRLSALQAANRSLTEIESFCGELRRLKDKKPDLDYDSIQGFYLNHGDKFENGNKILNSILNVFGNTEGVDTFLKLASYESDAHEIDIRFTNYFTSLLTGFGSLTSYLEDFALDQFKDADAGFSVIDLDDLDAKTSMLKPSNGAIDYSKWNLIRSLISFPHLKRIFNVLDEMHLFYLMQKNQSDERELYSLENFYAKKRHPSYGRDRFQNLLELVDVAITQENLLAGDFLLPHLYKKIFVEKIPQNEAEYQRIITLLNTNPLLKFNFSNYFVKRQLEVPRTSSNGETHKNSFFEYSLFLVDTSGFAQDVSNPTNLRQCFDKDLRADIILHSPTVKNDSKNESAKAITKRWKLDLYRDDREAYINLPTSSEFDGGKIRYRQEMYDLIALKKQILDQLSGYQLANYLSDNNDLMQTLRFGI